MTVDSSPVKFTPALPGQPVPEIRTISGGRPVFRAELPDGRVVWLVTGYENVRQMIIDQRFSRALAVAPGQAQPGFEMFAAGSVNGMDPPGLRCSRLGGLPPARVTKADVPIGGVTIPAGEQVMPLFGTANRDPSVFADPDRFDVTRDAASHLTFGAGVHHCLGAQLARVELQEAFRGLIGRLPGLRLAVPASELEFKPGMAIHSLRELPVLWGEP